MLIINNFNLKFQGKKCKSYVKLVFYLAICDFISSFCLSSTVSNGSILCWMQGIILNYSQLSSILWTNIIVYQLFVTVVKGKSLKKPFENTVETTLFQVLHVECWRCQNQNTLVMEVLLSCVDQTLK